jgi:hypothetical protein
VLARRGSIGAGCRTAGELVKTIQVHRCGSVSARCRTVKLAHPRRDGRGLCERSGRDVSTASVPLLTRIAGLSGAWPRISCGCARRGPFPNREALKDVPRMGPKTFEQAAGFLRVPQSDNLLTVRGSSRSLSGSRTHPGRHRSAHWSCRRRGHRRQEVDRKHPARNWKLGVMPMRSSVYPPCGISCASSRKGARSAPEFNRGLQGRHRGAWDLQPGMLLGVVTNVLRCVR